MVLAVVRTERVELDLRESTYHLSEQGVPRKSSKGVWVVDWEEELDLVHTLFGRTLLSGDPQIIDSLIQRVPKYRTIYRTKKGLKFKPFKEESTQEVLLLLTESMIAQDMLGAPKETRATLLENNLYRCFDTGHLPQSVVEVANRIRKRFMVPEVSLSERERKLLGLFSGIYILKEENSGQENLNPVPFDALFAKSKPMRGEFVLGILKSYLEYISSLPDLVPEGRQILQNVLLIRVRSFISGFNNWGIVNIKEVKRLKWELERASRQLDTLFSETVDNPEWRKSLSKIKPSSSKPLFALPPEGEY